MTGAMEGMRYFETPMLHGIFVWPQNVEALSEATPPSEWVGYINGGGRSTMEPPSVDEEEEGGVEEAPPPMEEGVEEGVEEGGVEVQEGRGAEEEEQGEEPPPPTPGRLRSALSWVSGRLFGQGEEEEGKAERPAQEPAPELESDFEGPALVVREPEPLPPAWPAGPVGRRSTSTSTERRARSAS